MTAPKRDEGGDLLLSIAVLMLTFVIGDVLKQIRKLKEVSVLQETELDDLRRQSRRWWTDPEPDPADVLEADVVEDAKPAPKPRTPRQRTVKSSAE